MKFPALLSMYENIQLSVSNNYALVQQRTRSLSNASLSQSYRLDGISSFIDWRFAFCGFHLKGLLIAS